MLPKCPLVFISGCLFALGALRAVADDAVPISLAGAIDFHCHSAPDTVARSVSSFDVVRNAKAAGMRAVVLKNHFVSTAALAQLAVDEIGGIEVFGGIVLNRSAGGINAEAVRKMAQVAGKRGRVVWLPTFDAQNQIAFGRVDRPFVAVVKDDQPVAALAEVFQAIAASDLIFATGHSAPAESLVLLRAAKAAGVKRLLVTHVLTDPTRATLEQMKQMAALGAVMEMTWLAHLGAPLSQSPGAPVSKAVPIADAARAIREIGAEHFILTSDLGQANNPLHPAGLRAFIAALREQSVSDAEIDRITRTNPAQLLGLPVQ
jgi:hypothetical protein